MVRCRGAADPAAPFSGRRCQTLHGKADGRNREIGDREANPGVGAFAAGRGRLYGGHGGTGGRVAFPGQYLSGARQMRCRARDGAYEAARDRGVGAPRSVDAGPEGRSVRKLYLAADDAPSGGEDRQAAGGRPVAVHGRRPRRDFPRMGAGAAALRRAVLLARRGRAGACAFLHRTGREGHDRRGALVARRETPGRSSASSRPAKVTGCPAACAACRSGRPTSTGSISPDPCGAGLRAA